MSVLAVVVGLVAGAVGGWCVPRLIAWVPEPEPDPTENPEEFPEKLLYRDLAALPGLARRSALACALAGGLIGLGVGWDWPLLWLFALVPVGCALAVIDWKTWFLPSRLVVPSFFVVALLIGLTALVTWDWHPLVYGAIGQAVLGGYYGLLWFISPRILAFGDVRLGWLLGLALGPLGAPALLVSALAAGMIGTLALLPMRRAGVMIKRNAPFGPFLVLGALVAVLV